MATARVSADGSPRYRAGECQFPAERLRRTGAASKVAPQIDPYLPLHRGISVQGQFFYHTKPGEGTCMKTILLQERWRRV